MRKISIILGALAIIGLCTGIFVMTSCQSNQSETPMASVPTIAEPRPLSDGGKSGTAMTTLHTPLGPASVVDIIANQAENSVQFYLEIEDANQTIVERRLDLQLSGDPSTFIQFSSRLRDREGEILWSCDQSVSSGGGVTRTAFWTNDRSVIAMHSRDESEDRTVYTVDGDQYVLAFPVDQLNYVVELVNQGTMNGKFNACNLAPITGANKDIIAQLENYQTFYFSHGEYAFGPEHLLGSALVRNEWISDRFVHELGADSGNATAKSFISFFCGVADDVTAVACLLGPADPICTGGVVIWAACRITKAVRPDLFN